MNQLDESKKRREEEAEGPGSQAGHVTGGESRGSGSGESESQGTGDGGESQGTGGGSGSTWVFLKSSIRKADILLFLALIVLGLALAGISLAGRTRGAAAVVRVDGKEYGRYPLSRSRTITIRQGQKKNVIRIRHGQVSMDASTCKNQICVKHQPIDATNETIICLPNRVSVEITGAGKRQGKDTIDVYS